MNVIITGASHGLGKYIAHNFCSHGDNIAICGRNEDDLKKTTKELEMSYKSTFIMNKVCDVSVEYDVNSFIDAAIKRFNKIDVIILNAGVYGPLGFTESVSLDEWKKAFDINLYGVLLPCRRIIPHFKQNKFGKIIVISGGGATNPMPNVTSYATSKCAVIRLMESLAVELKSFNIDVNAIAPGAMVTRLTDQIINVGPEIVGEEFYKKNVNWKNNGATSPKLGAELAYYLSSNESNGITGKLISAQWDNWSVLKSHIDELNTSDIYCLRRIVPEDRNKNWN